MFTNLENDAKMALDYGRDLVCFHSAYHRCNRKAQKYRILFLLFNRRLTNFLGALLLSYNIGGPKSYHLCDVVNTNNYYLSQGVHYKLQKGRGMG